MENEKSINELRAQICELSAAVDQLSRAVEALTFKLNGIGEEYHA